MSPAEAMRAAILAALGAAPEHIEPGKLHRFPTGKGRGGSAGWAKLFVDGRAGVYGDWRTGTVETWIGERPATNEQRAEVARQVEAARREREAAQREQWAANAERIARLWGQCLPVTAGDPVARYLERRGLGALPAVPECLRLHPALAYWHEGDKLGEYPAMVAPLIAPDGRTVALHRTFLDREGRKADVPAVKKLTGTAGPLAGCCIPLFHQRRGVLGVAEGVETALASFLGSGVPVVASYSAGALASWQWPQGVQRIIVFADADPAGRRAADTLRVRALGAGVRAEVVAPTDPGADWLDVWATRAALAEGSAA